jgi:hypothetical protein
MVCGYLRAAAEDDISEIEDESLCQLSSSVHSGFERIRPCQQAKDSSGPAYGWRDGRLRIIVIIGKMLDSPELPRKKCSISCRERGKKKKKSIESKEIIPRIASAILKSSSPARAQQLKEESTEAANIQSFSNRSCG